VDGSVNHKVHVFEVASGKCVFSQNGDANVIYDISFTNQPGQYTICTAGKKHVAFWEYAEQTKAKRKGILGKGNPLGTHMCATWDDQGTAYTGFQDGRLYSWKGNMC
jgi:hypothetical protein